MVRLNVPPEKEIKRGTGEIGRRNHEKKKKTTKRLVMRHRRLAL